MSEHYSSVIDAKVQEIVDTTQAPQPLAIQAVLGTIAFASQGAFKVRTPFGETHPISGIFAGIAESGIGKSAVLKSAVSPIEEFLQEEECAHQERHERYIEEHQIWHDKLQALRNNLKKAFRDASSEDASIVQEAEADIEAHRKKEPTPPSGPVMEIFSDTTASGMLNTVRKKDLKSIALVSGEAGELLGKNFLEHLATFSSLWDGDGKTMSRYNYNVHLDFDCTMILFMQPSILESFSTRQNKRARSSGFLARTLLTQGNNIFLPGERQTISEADERHQRYKDRVHWLLSLTRDLNKHKEPKIGFQFTPEAEARFRQVANEIKASQYQLKTMESAFPDFSSKLIKHIARLSALFALANSESAQPEIDLQSQERAIELTKYYENQFANIIWEPPQELKDVDGLDAYFAKKRQEGWMQLARSAVLQYSPVRQKDRLDLCLSMLINQGKIGIFQTETRDAYGRRGKPMQWIDISAYPPFPPGPRGDYNQLGLFVNL